MFNSFDLLLIAAFAFHETKEFLFWCFFREMCVRFADLERKLGEIDRARAIYMHASQMADPRVITIGSLSSPNGKGNENLTWK